ncbi:ParB/RepB/Spo0J family partition protein [Heliorestis acidaminivorans]|uniref:ParB/RepB/Spo0J family partition protein n=2 Tax=Heliorestis acidaminivorans TaxID=553427 RepID=A0A6I0F3L1_9FIRM|nr:ParB/RepB/Spo0J family partition protein [Heliorestis acidaminivorans]
MPTIMDQEQEKDDVTEIYLDQIDPNPDQPRKHFENNAIEELAASIEEHGLIQPLVVRPTNKGRYQIVVGERRWRACKTIGIQKVPVLVRSWDNQKVAEIALIENIQRQDLSPLEEAEAYKTLLQDFKLTQEELARRVGKSRTYITNTLRILQLNQKVQDMIGRGQISIGHAKVILALPDAEEQEMIAHKIIDQGWSVRKAEEHIRDKVGREKKVTKKPEDDDTKKDKKDPEIIELEERMRSWLKTQVKIKDQGQKGSIEITYYSLEDLQRIFDCFFDEEYK